MNRAIVALLVLVPGMLELGCCQACRQKRADQDSTAAMSGADGAIASSATDSGILLASATVSADGGYGLNAQNTRVEFVGARPGKSQRGSFKQLRGTIEAPNGDLSAGRLAIEISMNSVSTDNFLLTKHLKSSDFFDVSQYPTASFVTTAIRPARSKDATHVLIGRFTMHGQSRELEVPAKVSVANDAIALDCTFVLKQSDYGMNEALKRSDDEVPVTVSIRAARLQ